jgi:peptidoglycan/LPS O-acetylase OafA/YrhL
MPNSAQFHTADDLALRAPLRTPSQGARANEEAANPARVARIYRKDVQILRGIAVLLVVLYHLGASGFDSGFLGVDVFFVISGYLMAVMYTPSDKAAFFAKRARRLLPAYLAVVVLTLIAAIFVTTPADFAQVSNQSLFAAFFASNIGFWMENSYFDKEAFKPLLHLWSLGVEIQFYLLVPFLYWAFARARVTYPLILAASALLCFYVVGVSPKTAFFWLPLRLWQFLIGFGVAMFVYKGEDGKNPLTLLGAASIVAIIGIPFLAVDGQTNGFRSGHPGLVALLISVATATVLAFGVPERLKSNPISDRLERLGDYSYSIYLAHFPLIVLFLYEPFSGTVLEASSLGQTAALTLMIVCASALLFHLVEQPFRRGRAITAPHMMSAIAVLGVSAIAILGIGALGKMAQQATISEKEMAIYQAWFDRDVYRCGKINRIIHPRAISCEITTPIASPSHRVMLVGNSHADSIKATFAAAAQAQNVSVFFMVENDPLTPERGGVVTPESLVKEAQARKAASIVLHYSPGSIDPHVIHQLAALARENSISLSFIMPVPVWGEKHVPRSLWRHLKQAEELPSQTIADYRNFNRTLVEGLAGIDGGALKVYQVADVLCRKVCLLSAENGKPLYFDEGHLTLTGSGMLRGVFDRVIADLPSPGGARKIY